MRRPGWSWDGSFYQKPTRSQGADKDGLCAAEPALRVLLSVAPSGFPNQQGVKNVLMELHRQHGILECEPRFVEKVAADSADVWRVMCKDVYDLRKLRCPEPSPKLRALMGLIDTGIERASSADSLCGTLLDGTDSDVAPSKPGRDIKVADVHRLFGFMKGDGKEELDDEELDDDVQIVAMKCKCATCHARARHRELGDATLAPAAPSTPLGAVSHVAAPSTPLDAATPLCASGASRAPCAHNSHPSCRHWGAEEADAAQ